MGEKKESKIIVKSTDELSDIIEKISSSNSDRIILTFTEPSDLLISSINLKVIKESAQEEGISLISQIIKNPTGERNAQQAGLMTINTPNNPTGNMWEEVEKDMKNNIIEKEELLGQRQPKTTKEERPDVHKSSFEQRIEEALSKSKATPTSAINKTKLVEEEGVKISLDGEINQGDSVDEKEVDNSDDREPVKPKDEKVLEKVEIKNSQEPNITNRPVGIPSTMNMKEKKKINILSTVKGFFAGIFKKKGSSTSPSNIIKLKRTFPKKYILWGSVGVLLIALVGVGLYYYFAPLVKVKLYIDSKAVSAEKTFTGSLEISAIDLEDQIVPLIEEEVEKDSSQSIIPTGKSVTGEKATGTVRVNYLEIGETLNLPSGTVLTGNGKKFVSLADLNLIGPSWSELSVEAADYGSEYNVPFGTYFTVDGQSDDLVSGSALDDFSGGSKTEVTVLSQGDVDTASKNLAEIAKEDAEGDLLDKHIGDGWEVISDSIVSTIDEDSVETDVPIGSETTEANISLTVKVTALYYKKSSLDEIVSDILSEEAKNKDLFSTENDTDLELADDTEVEFTVSGEDVDDIKIKLEASGVVTPKVSKDEILSTLKGMKWGEGINYVTSFDYSEKVVEVGYQPEIIPMSLRYFPRRQGRILITTIYVEE